MTPCGFLCVQSLFSTCDSAPFFRTSYLDYLSLDFNSASPSPVQKVSMHLTLRQRGKENQRDSDWTGIKNRGILRKRNAFSLLNKTVKIFKKSSPFTRYFHSQKPLLDEQRVDYVQVDEKKTQALQNTRTEWKDSRQPKV